VTANQYLQLPTTTKWSEDPAPDMQRPPVDASPSRGAGNGQLTVRLDGPAAKPVPPSAYVTTCCAVYALVSDLDTRIALVGASADQHHPHTLTTAAQGVGL
jgi:hypothetical protein